ncbi:DNA topoisomerase 1 [Carpediemonas membranifera]|uniref:DNA topoisomerase 1 n=1 Tax=Carpediemonas membranifera TaxID=201153 RepID=A0A8J6E6E7_9EUKA|nr:DNA topoisomerase 1 [Carpediemonas membranifera]|eukprot:KAG9389485.1 DNA topoisomerase 1 [Carpediemonas membranifera]
MASSNAASPAVKKKKSKGKTMKAIPWCLKSDVFGIPEGTFLAPEFEKATSTKRKAGEAKNTPKKRSNDTPSSQTDTTTSDAKKEPAKKKAVRLTPDHPVPTVDELLGEGNYIPWWDDVDMEALSKSDLSSSNGDDDDDEPQSPKAAEVEGWTTCTHNGIMFEPPYEPHGVPLVYDGVEYVLPPHLEEIATMFAAELHTPYSAKEVFCKNFWTDFQKCLNPGLKKKEDRHPIQYFKLADFSKIWKHLNDERQKKLLISKEEKAALAAQTKTLRDHYGFATIDGARIEVGPWKVEPPHLYKGRGNHPMQGHVTKRIMPEDVTLNLDYKSGCNPPTPNVPGRWGEIQCLPDVQWIAAYSSGEFTSTLKYMRPGATSPMKGRSDLIKFNLARKLTLRIDELRKSIEADMAADQPMDTRQRAVVIHVIDRLAIRAGGDKDTTKTADTVGVCNLRVEHVTLDPATRSVSFDFLGKDSIRYQRTEVFDPLPFQVFADSIATKGRAERLWSAGTHGRVNEWLSGFMPGLSLKVLRTFNACVTLDKLLWKTPKGLFGKDVKLKEIYTEANKEVALMCNHQKSAAKGHEASVRKGKQKADEAKAAVEEVGACVVALLGFILTQFDVDEDEAVVDAALEAVGISRDKAGVAPTKEQTKLLNPLFSKKMKGSDEAVEFDPTLKQALAKLKTTTAKLSRTRDQLARLSGSVTERESLKTVALGTSRLNYLDPRITVAWCRREGFPITKVFNKTLLTKFPWALDVPAEWVFRPEE